MAAKEVLAVSDEKSLDRLISLSERQIAVQMHFAGASQDAIAKVLGKSKGWVNALLRGLARTK